MEKVRLGDVCTINGGYAFKSDQFSTEGVPVIRIGNITKEGLIIDEDVCYDEKFWNENDSYRIAENDILIAMSGATVGKSCINNTERKLLLNQRVAAINCDSNINLKYIFYSIDSEKFSKYIMTNSSGCAQPNISLKQIANFEISAVCLEEQNRIADELDKVTDVINKRKQQISKLDELVKARFVELFGDPQTNPNGYAWVKLSDVATYFNGLTYKPENVAEVGTIVLRSSNIQSSQLDFADTVRVDCTVKEKLMVQENDILMCSRNGSARLVGKVALIKGIQEPMTFGAFMMIIRSRYHSYLMTYFQMDAFRQQIKTGATTTINQITGRMLDEVTIPLPPMELVEQFTAFVEQTDKSKLETQKSLEKLELLKKALMQKYFG